MRILLWLIRREIWENKAIWAVPTLVGGLLLLAAMFGDADIGPTASLGSPDQPRVCGAILLFGFGITLFFVMSIYSAWYLLDCLYVERKDRSSLFWKSLPVSDAQTVLSKLMTALVVIPCVAFVAADLTTLGMASAVSVRAADGEGISDMLWRSEDWLQLQVLWIYLIATMAIWYLPVAGWLLVISAWARRSVMLWAIMPVAIVYLIERWFIGTHVIAALIKERFAGFVPHAFHNNADEAFSLTTVTTTEKVLTLPSARTVWELIDLKGFLSTPAMWAGVAVGVVLLALAVNLRRRRADA